MLPWSIFEPCLDVAQPYRPLHFLMKNSNQLLSDSSVATRNDSGLTSLSREGFFC